MYYYYYTEQFSNQDKLLLTQIIVTIIGGLWVIYLYVKSQKDKKNNFLKIYLDVIYKTGYTSIKTSVVNDTNDNKKIEAAFLFITKVNTDFLEEINRYLNSDFKDTNSLLDLKNRNPLLSENFGFIQLPFYTKENIRVGNEDLTYSIPLTNTNIESDLIEQSAYDVRFFVFPPNTVFNSFHRCVQDIFIINSNDLSNSLNYQANSKLNNLNKKVKLQNEKK